MIIEPSTALRNEYSAINNFEIFGGSTMKNIVLIIVGLTILLFVVICPYPTMLAISGVVWRIMIGLFGCFLLALGIFKSVRRR